MTSTTNHTNKETNVQYEKINQNSLAQFMRTRERIVHVSADLYRWIDKAGALHVGVTKPGTTYRAPNRGQRPNHGKSTRRLALRWRRELRGYQAAATATA